MTQTYSTETLGRKDLQWLLVLRKQRGKNRSSEIMFSYNRYHLEQNGKLKPERDEGILNTCQMSMGPFENKRRKEGDKISCGGIKTPGTAEMLRDSLDIHSVNI